MKRTFTPIFLALFLSSGLQAQTLWQPYSEVSDNWPNNDIRSHGSYLYVASNDGIFRSADNGITWTDLTASFSASSDMVELEFTNNGDIFARANSFGVVRSLDNGSTWEIDTTGVGSNYGTDMLYYDSIANRVFLGVGYPKYKLYYQAPTDPSWTAVTGMPSSITNFAPTQMTRKGSKLFVTDVYKRVFESTDNGLNWTQKTATGLGNADAQVGPGRFLAIGNDLFLGCGNVWKSSDDGDSWTAVDQGFPLQSGLYVDTRCLYYDGSKLYAATYTDRKTFVSSDNGATWTDFGGSGSWFFKAMAMHGGELYGVVHSKDSIYKYGGSGPVSTTEIKRTEAISIYPNPATDRISISNIKAGTQLIVRDLTGRMVHHEIVNANTARINTESWTNGVYLVQVESRGAILETKKLVISR